MTPLAPNEVAVLQRALPLARIDASAAEQLVRGLPAAARRHPDALFVLAQALRGQNRFPEALKALETALAGAPRHPQLHNAHGNCLADLGQADLALAALARATAIDPAYAEAWINAGIIATRYEHLSTASAALARARLLRPREAKVLNALGALAEASGDRIAAMEAYDEALILDPGDSRSRHNLAAILRSLDRAAEALALLDAAPAKLLAPSATLRAHLLAELAKFDAAVDQYRAVIDEDPRNLDAQHSLARLLPQIGLGEEALDGFAAALRGPASPHLWGAAIGAALAGNDASTALRWIAGAEAAHGTNDYLALARARALAALGERVEALATLRALEAVSSSSAAVHVNLAHLLLQDADPAEAVHHAEKAALLAPLDQSGWALLATAWRLTGEPRHDWLIDTARLVMPVDLDVPSGWRDRDSFIADVAVALDRCHLTTAQPADQSLRGGTQTGGNLFDRADPVLRALAASIQTTAARALATLPADPDHPFLGRNTGRIDFAGSWSVRLRHSGFHIDHIHPQGWLSSALHIAVPPAVDGNGAGDLRFGVPDATLGLDLPPLRVETPVPGRLVLFPSYFWHGTVPFDGDQPRLTVAFDAVPLG